jgi:predicted dehydrogenase
METTLHRMDACAAIAERRDASKFSELVGALGDPDWRVRYAAIVALGDLGDPQAVDPLCALLRAEASEPIFTQPPLKGGGYAGATHVSPIAFPAGTTEEVKEAWRRRGRLLQAGCLALGNLGSPTAPLLDLLHDFATDQKRDYVVRAAACKALGQLACPGSLPAVEQATQDEEWCTACEARKAVAAITRRVQVEARVRIGIVGLNFGRHIIEQLTTGPGRDWFELAGVCDLDAAKVRQYSEQTGARAYRDLTELLADPTVPAVGLFSPPIGRANLIRQIIRAGKHVLTTKPFELDALAAAEVLAEARQLGRVIHLNSPGPTLPPDLAQIKQWQRQYQLGRPVGCRADVWASYREQTDGSWYDDPNRCPVAPVFRLGIYLINDLISLFGEAAAVQVMHTRLHTGRPTPDNAQLAIRFRNGGLANIFASFCVNDGDQYRNGLTLNFENGTVYRNAGPTQTAGVAELSVVVVKDGHRHIAEQVTLQETSSAYQWKEFAEAIQTGTLTNESLDRAIVAGIQVIEAMARAEKSAVTVELEETT